MLALLHFVSNDYESAGKFAQRAMLHGQKQKLNVSLPEYIHGVSLLYERDIDFETVVRHFSNSLRAQPENTLAPLMYAVILDRVHYRMNEGSLGAAELNQIAFWTDPSVLGREALPVHVVLLARYLLRLFDSQQAIELPVSLDGENGRYEESNVLAARQALGEYRVLIEGGHFLVGAISVLGQKAPKTQTELVKQAETLGVEFRKYADDYSRLENMLSTLEAGRVEHIAKLARLAGEAAAAEVEIAPDPEEAAAPPSGANAMTKTRKPLFWFSALIAICGLGFLAWRVIHVQKTITVDR